MKKLLFTFLVSTGTIFFSCQRTYTQSKDYKNASLTIEERVDALLPKMSLEEKVAQMRIFHANIGVEAEGNGNLKLSDKVIEKLKLGIAGIKNPGEHMDPVAAAKFNNDLQKYIIENNRWGIPALFVTESYNGVDAAGSTRFGRPLTSAASFNPQLVNRIWDVVGREARLRGMHMCHSPEADLVRDPRFGRMSEAFGEDTYLTTQMVVNAINGVQGNYDGLGNGTHIGAVAKHFAGYGQVLGGSNFAAIEISPRTLIDEIYPPFEAAVKEAKTLGIMASHGDINGVASHGNPELLTGVLRDQWGFKGYVVSDSNDIARLFYFMNVAESPEEAAQMGLEAGIDIDLYAEDSYAYLPEMVKKNPNLEKLIDRSVRRVLRTKFILGLFDNPYIDIEEVKKGVRANSSLTLAKESDLESIILLKNENKILPLNKNKTTKIALLGPLVKDDTKSMFETVASKHISFVAEKGFHLTDEKGGAPKLLERDENAISKMVNMAKNSDLSILFLGGDEFTSKEAFFNNALGDRATIEPVGAQDELIEKIKALGKPVIVVLKHRRTLAINTISEQADAILDTWDLSEFGDESTARIIFGEVSPSGKLPVTVPRSIGQIPFHYSMKEINYKKGYLFMEDGPLYPFGYGLSYSNFEYSDIKKSNSEMTKDSEIEVSVTIKNTGNVKAKEVVQMYIKDVKGSVIRPDKELKGFEKISLNPGESKKVSFKITPEMLKFTGLKMEKVLESGEYTVMIGTSSVDYKKTSFQLKK
ncbi:beta-glucosidase (GH3) [Formosa agariphila KMM 3901]|uniref:Putative beta-xylosidase n=1 Tax=Formosa agariphila (strain DSM 15362 / KCTC 12365 / LMG 23005 / KMM 3901 / M-2Alg 35-1) TaxID=1347342 RepID=PLH34_FORAG|nr:glycoside hydrolase family 3 N-terminal domain-containing protein [Formosa agariphila]T2KMH9.1 RecName: Full=Putative beta-xylosidase; AltName: Full=Glycosyl hydrolase 3 family protein P34; Short=P34_GH3; AltName: Full=Polysaccharide utilization locus H protein P34; Short=PUL H protein P34; Flags: Precursor [Formosa agariphila KMM 3901]CDF79935.1 beta-glucosidase (GH3) [Formosa agariphila KMM 3901]